MRFNPEQWYITVRRGKELHFDKLQVDFGGRWLSGEEVVQTHCTDREAGTTKCC